MCIDHVITIKMKIYIQYKAVYEIYYVYTVNINILLYSILFYTVQPYQ